MVRVHKNLIYVNQFSLVSSYGFFFELKKDSELLLQILHSKFYKLHKIQRFTIVFRRAFSPPKYAFLFFFSRFSIGLRCFPS